MDVAELQRHRIEEIDPEFLTRFPIARVAMVYEFGSLDEAEAAKATLLAAAFTAGEPARVMRMEWNGRQRVLAIRM